MPFIDIVSCYVSDTIKFNGDLPLLRQSFISNGFKEKQIDDSTWKYVRGAGLALEFDYGSESLQMNVFISRIDETLLEIKVGNSGFPFEPLMMKKRFIKNLENIVREIEENGELKVNEEAIQSIQKDSKRKKAAAIVVIALAVTVVVLLKK